jgi:hypothetical protein
MRTITKAIELTAVRARGAPSPVSGGISRADQRAVTARLVETR